MHPTYFAVWSHGFASSEDHVALLACVALNGYHPRVSYQWACDGRQLESETYPILYATAVGKFSCSIVGTDIHAEN